MDLNSISEKHGILLPVLNVYLIEYDQKRDKEVGLMPIGSAKGLINKSVDSLFEPSTPGYLTFEEYAKLKKGGVTKSNATLGRLNSSAHGVMSMISGGINMLTSGLPKKEDEDYNQPSFFARKSGKNVGSVVQLNGSDQGAGMSVTARAYMKNGKVGSTYLVDKQVEPEEMDYDSDSSYDYYSSDEEDQQLLDRNFFDNVESVEQNSQTGKETTPLIPPQDKEATLTKQQSESLKKQTSTVAANEKPQTKDDSVQKKSPTKLDSAPQEKVPAIMKSQTLDIIRGPPELATSLPVPGARARGSSIADRSAALAYQQARHKSGTSGGGGGMFTHSPMQAMARRKNQRAESGRRLGPMVEGSIANELEGEPVKGRDKKAKTEKAMKRPKALQDPKVRKQLAKMRIHKPIFLIALTVVHVVMMGYEIYYNGGFAAFPSVNPFFGPGFATLTRLGAKFVDCMKLYPSKVDDFMECPASGNYDTSLSFTTVNQNNQTVCAMKYYDFMASYCGMGGFQTQGVPDQWWRFITPIFLHVGILHLALNMNTQIRIGIPMERQIGTIRMMLLYLLAGVGGNLFGAIMTDTVSVGVSSSLYGLYGILCLDLFQNWPLLITPWRDAAQLMVQIAFALALGVVFPYIDNYAHVGGFVVGLLGGLVLMPTIKFGILDRLWKLFLKWSSVPVLAVLLAYGFYNFYFGAEGAEVCQWCRYLNCAVPMWCPSSTSSSVASHSD